jgi:hypothetical protein
MYIADSISLRFGITAMMGSRLVEQGALFYKFSLDAHVPLDHLLTSIDVVSDRACPTNSPANLRRGHQT